MGNKCEKQKTESVINLSESCVDRLIREEKESGKKSPGEELNIKPNITEKQWIMKLKCLDDAHSNMYGLTVQAFYNLADKVEKEIQPIERELCLPEEIIKCFKKYPCCTIKCREVVAKYIDCIDLLRINLIKEQIECDLKEQNKKEHDLVEEFLKNEN